MLTLVKTPDATPIVGIYTGKNAKRPDQTVYFTHETEKGNQNVADAEGVLHLHRRELKKEFKLNDADFKEVCRMIDAEEEPESTDPLKTEYWSILDRYENFLQREMWIGDGGNDEFPVEEERLGRNDDVHRLERQRQDVPRRVDDPALL